MSAFASVRVDDVALIEQAIFSEQSVVASGNSLALAALWPEASVQCVYIDPPFGTGKTQAGRAATYRDDLASPRALTQFLLPWLEHSQRVLTATGSLFVHLDWRAVHYVKVLLDELFGPDLFVNEIIWCYAVGGKSPRRFGQKHDTILWYAKSEQWSFYPDAIAIPRRAGSHMKLITRPDGTRVQSKTDRRSGKTYEYPLGAGKVPEDWWSDIETLNHSDAERVGYPSQKPLRLLERVIKATTQPGEWVADWFSGSGTTAVAAHGLGRRFVVADQNPPAITATTARLSQLDVG
ncbi:MAG: site-specific DNA-methyltransferase [Myxococcales bacterium]|nr:site-specific DNA-methyltransferase [Myxococcales bacterium]